MDKVKELIWDDTIFLKKQEHVISVFFRFLKNISIFFIFSLMLSYILYTLIQNAFLSIFIIVWSIIMSIFYIRIFYKDTYIILTNTKILKSVRNWLFSSHIIELPLSRIRQIRANNNGIFAKIFWYGDIEIQGFEESSNMYFKAMSQNKQAMREISNAIEWMKQN